jgi:hypothetical protein
MNKLLSKGSSEYREHGKWLEAESDAQNFVPQAAHISSRNLPLFAFGERLS